jgi:membrane protease YdiL (CAAX protease family)
MATSKPSSPALTDGKSGTRAADQTGAALDIIRIAAAWLLGGVVPVSLWYAFDRVLPAASGEYGPFVTAFLEVCVVLIFIWRWPRVFRLSRLRLQLSDLAVGIMGGYLCLNVEMLIPAIPIKWPLATSSAAMASSLPRELLFVCHVLVIPAAEELFSRGVILASLCKRMSVPWAILITSVAGSVLHLPPTRWLSVFVGWAILCGIYLARDRSLPASITAHAVTNALVWFPNLVVARHFLN